MGVIFPGAASLAHDAQGPPITSEIRVREPLTGRLRNPKDGQLPYVCSVPFCPMTGTQPSLDTKDAAFGPILSDGGPLAQMRNTIQ